MPLTKYVNTPDEELIVHAYTEAASDELVLEMALRLEHLLEEVESLLNGSPDAVARLQEIIDGANSRG